MGVTTNVTFSPHDPNVSYPTMSRLLISLIVLGILTIGRGLAQDAATSRELLIPAVTVEASGQTVETTLTGAVVSLSGQQIVIPPAADTFLWKGGKDAQGGGKGVMLRDARWSQGLIRLDLATLAGKAPIEAAKFRFKMSSVEREGKGAKFLCHRMLVDWSEQATWLKPASDAAPWDGLKPGVHFEAAPFATVSLEAVQKGDLIEIPGFEKALEAWRSGQWENHGFLLLLSGGAIQATFPSREAAGAGSSKDVTLGGPQPQHVTVGFDPQLVRQIVPRPENLESVALRVRVLEKKEVVGKAILAVSVAGGAPLASVPLSSAGADGWVVVPGLSSVIDSSARVELALAVLDAPKPLRISGMAIDRDTPKLAVTLRAAVRPQLFQSPIAPQKGVYTTAKDGHFFYGEKRLRLWGALGKAGFERVKKMGFNAWRMWGPSNEKFYTAESLRTGDFAPVKKGDGSPLDDLDRQYASCKEQGLFVMATQLTGAPMPAKLLAADDSFVAGGEDWAEWKKAILDGAKDIAQFTFFDERLQKAKKKHAGNFLNRTNDYTGRRYAEEECIAIYELNNENGFVLKVLEGESQKWPAYFREKLERRWNQWLANRYPTEAALKTAWGALDAGEKQGAVKLGPTVADRKKFSEARGSDFVRFAIELMEGWNTQLRDFCRQQAPAGTGVAVVPFSFDTQYRGNLPWHYSLAHAGDTATFGMYFWNTQSALAKPPSLYVLDSHTVAGKPTVIYETNSGRPNPYRSEYPLMLAAFASWEDWDAIFFHYWSGEPTDVPDERYLLMPLLPSLASHYWTSVQHQSDPVMCATMAIAGRMFLNGAVAPAPNPAIYEAGAGAIFGYNFHNGVGIRGTAFTRGSRLHFSPEKASGLTLDGQPPSPVEPAASAVASGDSVLWDWPNGRLIIDAPSYKAYVGRSAGAYRFKDGTVLSGLGAPWVSWAMSSADGAPLAEARKLLVASVWDAKNTGFEMNATANLSGPMNQANAVINRGRLPVIQDAVPFTVQFPTKLEANFHAYDFALRETAQIPVSNSNVLRYEGAPLFMGVLEIAQRGQAVETPASSLATNEPSSRAGVAAAISAAPLPGVWSPIHGLTWGSTPESAQEVIRTTKPPLASVTPGTDPSGRKTQSLAGSRFLWDAPADALLTFGGGGLQRIEATFTQPPSFTVAIADYEKQFGPPATKKLTSQEGESVVTWSVKRQEATLSITLSETQGTMRAIFEVLRQ